MDALTLRDHLGTRALDAEAAGRDALRLARAAAEAARRRYALALPDVDDLVGDLMLLLWTRDGAALRRANPATPLRAWLDGAVRRLVARSVSRRRRACDLPRLLAARDEARALARGRTAVARRLRLEAARSRDLAALPDAQREVLVLHLSGLGERAVAERLGLCRESVRDRLHRAWRRLEEGAPVAPVGHAAALVLLGARDRMAAELRLKGLTLREIGVRLGCTRDAARALLQRARRRALGCVPDASSGHRTLRHRDGLAPAMHPS